MSKTQPVESNAKPSVLIVDDDPSILRFLQTRCEKLGLDVRTASNGLQALAMAQRMRPDVLIVDVNMPEVDGLSLCFHLLRPELRGLEVIVISGKPDDEAIERCAGLGARFARKGPELWHQVRETLNASFPSLPATADAFDRMPVSAAVSERPRILIVDDDPDVGQFLESRLRKLGLDPVLAKDGFEAFRLAMRQKPSVILSDCYMANGDISYLISRLRSTAGMEKIPVMAMSARPVRDLEQSQLLKDILGRQGPQQVFTKPLDLQKFLEAIKPYVAI